MPLGVGEIAPPNLDGSGQLTPFNRENRDNPPVISNAPMFRSNSNIAQVGSNRHASKTRLGHSRGEPAEFGIEAERI